MDNTFKMISVDDHVQEPANLWTDRLSKNRWGERIPHIERQPDGTERWLVDRRMLPLGGVAAAGAAMDDRSALPQRWDEVPRAAYIPAERLKAMDADGVDCSVLYPTVPGLAGEIFGRILDPELELACILAYNDWLVEEWTGASARFIPQCLVPLSSVDAAVKEIERSVAKGHRGVILPGIPMELRDLPHINDSAYDPLWAACRDACVPICFHAGASAATQLKPYSGFPPAVASAFGALTRPASTIFVVVNLLMSRILFRFPQLKIVFSESALGWGSYLLEYADYQFEHDHIQLEGYLLKPSELFQRQCFLTGWYDAASLHNLGLLTTDNILWCTNFPLATSTWPDSQRFVERSFVGIAESARRQILWENAAQLYKIDKNDIV
jgi:predicted TIM-barrel fold metal-dependent hydrolase